MQLYASLKINLYIPFPNSIKACKIFQPIIPVAYPYIKDSVVVSQNKNQSKTKQKTLQVYAIKCIDRKTEVRRVQTESVLGSVGMFTSPSLWFSPSLDNSWCISSNPCEKTSKHCFSHFFSVR